MRGATATWSQSYLKTCEFLKVFYLPPFIIGIVSLSVLLLQAGANSR